MTKAQERYSKQANKHRREVNFDVKDKVQATTKHWRTDRPNKKLSSQNAGPFEILEKVNHSFKLDLPPSIKVYPVFYANKLRKHFDNPLRGQLDPEPEPLNVYGDDEYEVEEIISARLVYRLLRYKVKWQGLDDDPVEYSLEDLRHAPFALRTFYEKYPRRLGPPKNLQYQIRCVEDDVQPESRPDDNEPVAGSRARLPAKGTVKQTAYSLRTLGTSFPEGGGNVTVIIIVSLTGSLRKGYGLIDDVASYSSNQRRRQRVAESKDNFFFPDLQTIFPSLIQNRLSYGTIRSIQSFLIMIVTLF